MRTSSKGVRPPALVLGLGPGGLGVVRSLSRLGVEVYGLYPGGGFDVGHHSRLLRRRFPTRPGITDAELTTSLQRLRQLVSPTQRMALIPSNDGYARLVSTHRGALEEDFLLRVPPARLETTFLDKRATAQLCQQEGMPVPRSFVPDDIGDVDRMADELRFPGIVKPAYQEDPDFPGKNAIVRDAEELLAFYRRYPNLVERTMVQELLAGGDGHIVGINTYSNGDGRVIAWTSHRRLRQWLPDRGATCYGVTETFDELRRQTVDFLDRLGYVGWAGIEYAEDVETGEYRFLELNARVVLPNQLFADAGVDLTAIGYLEMCGVSLPLIRAQQDGVYWMDLHRDLASSVLKWRRGQLSLGDWLESLTLVSSHATFAVRDPKPFAATIALLASVAAGRRGGRQLSSLRPAPEMGQAADPADLRPPRAGSS